VRRELAGSLGSWGSWGLRGKPGHPCGPPAREQGSRAAPALGVSHLGPGLGQGWAGHESCGELDTITPLVYPSLPSLPQASKNPIRAALSQYPGDACLPVTLPRNTSFNAEGVVRGSFPGPPSLLGA